MGLASLSDLKLVGAYPSFFRFGNHARPKTHGSNSLPGPRLVGADPSFLGLASMPNLS
jgi:hypothetical protein